MSKQTFTINWRYAAGEFIIVVLSIIVAFQLDAWKANRDNKELLEDYLMDLKVGLLNDSLYYDMANDYFQNIGALIDSTEGSLPSNQVQQLPYSAQKSLRQFSDWYHIYISNAAFEDLSNSGRLNLIQQKSLRYNLISYYQYIEFVKVLDEEYHQSLSRMQENLLTRLDLRDTSTLSIPAEEVPMVMNYLQQKRSYMRNYMSHRSICHDINANIRKQINSLLKPEN